jgi:hypothetical protein
VGNAAVGRLVAQRCGPVDGEVDMDAEPVVQRAPQADNPTSREPKPLGPLREAAATFLAKYGNRWGYDVDALTDALVARLGESTKDYAFVRAVIDELPSAIEDNVAADLVNRLPVPISVIGLSGEGRALLDVLYEAMITGNVSKFERARADEIISYRRGRVVEADFVGGMGRRMIFPIRNIGVTRLATATFKAELKPNGKVGLHYSSVVVTQYDMFKEDLQTLPDWTHLSNGIELDPNQVVAVHLFDLENHPTLDITALELIDYSNQIKEKTLGTAQTAFMLGLTVGFGGLGGGSISSVSAKVLQGEASTAALWATRALVWGDRIQFAIQAGSMVINDHRDWIVDTFPSAGPALLDAVDTANRLAGYYGWARLGIDGIRLVRSKLGPAVDNWRSARQSARLDASDAAKARAVEAEGEELAAEMAHAEEQAAARGDRGRVTPPANAKVRKTVAGGQHEVHVSEERIEICPVQLCDDLKDAVGSGKNDPKVEKEVTDAENARRAGDASAAANLAEHALIDAGVARPSAKDASTTLKDAAKRLNTEFVELQIQVASRRFRDALKAHPEGGPVRGELDHDLRALSGEVEAARDMAEETARANDINPNPESITQAMDEVHALQKEAGVLQETVDKIEDRLAASAPPKAVTVARPPTEAELALARDVRLSPDTPAIQHSHMTCQDFIAQFRDPGVERVFPGEYLPRTVAEALTDVARGTADSVVRKMLVDGRFAK